MAEKIYKSNGSELHLTDFDTYATKTAEGIIAINNSNALKRPYWILHLDCGRKGFSVANIKILIDLMHENGLNQLQLHFSENSGFRFALDDMNIIDVDGNTYDLSPCLTTTNGGYLTQADMDEIIMYARSKTIDVVPSLEMPGHMGTILGVFTQFRYPNTTKTLNVKNTTAKNFAFAFIEKYARYFKSRGCHFYNIGADELIGVKWSAVPSDDRHYFLEFVNEAMWVVARCGLSPRVFNDGVMFNHDRSVYYNRNVQVYCWHCMDGDMNLSTSELISNGFEVINTNHDDYYVTPGSYGNYRRNLNVNTLLTNFKTGSVTKPQAGFMFCIWCDSDDSSHTGDNGDGVITDMRTILPNLGQGIVKSSATIDYPIID